MGSAASRLCSCGGTATGSRSGATMERDDTCPPLRAQKQDKILATTYVPERLPSQYLRRWRA